MGGSEVMTCLTHGWAVLNNDLPYSWMGGSEEMTCLTHGWAVLKK
jgi:hypothetical protein